LRRLLRAFALGVDHDRIDHDERAELENQSALVAGKFPSVTVEPVVLRGRTANAPLAHCRSTNPSVLVLGSRGRGGFEGPLLGSTSHEAVAYVTCPVIVVPEPHH
jgi:nucleotide-binding universal stress UspA family protein